MLLAVPLLAATGSWALVLTHPTRVERGVMRRRTKQSPTMYYSSSSFFGEEVNGMGIARKRRRLVTRVDAVEERGTATAFPSRDEMRKMRERMEENEETALMMRALRGQNMNDDDRQIAGVDMQVVEVADSSESSLPLRYDPEALEAFFSKRPVAVAKRLVQIASASGGLVGNLVTDAVLGKLEEAEVTRAEELRRVLVSLGPFFIKLGQALSIRPDVLSPRAMTELQQLCDKVPSFDSSVAFACIESELSIRAVSDVFETITPEPVAAASLGQVYKARLRENGDVVAVKVQRPFVLETVSLDIYLVRKLGQLLKKVGLGERLDLVALLDEFASRFYDELDYVVECENGVKVMNDMAKLPKVKIPKNYPALTTRRVHVAEWVEGEKLSQSTADDVQELVELGVVTYLTQLLDTGFFHADPHPGNMLRTNDGRLCILDFGLMTQVTEDQRFGMIEAIAHLIHRDYDQIGDDFVKLDFIPQGTDVKPIIPALSRVFDAALSGGGAKSINFNDLAADLATITFEYPFRIPPYFALVIRAIGVLEGIALVADKDFAIVDESYPWIARKLLTDPSPRMQDALRYMIYGKTKRFDVDRLVDMLQALERFQSVKNVATAQNIQPGGTPQVLPPPSVVQSGGGESALALTRPQSSQQPLFSIQQSAVGGPDAATAREALRFFFGKDGALFRDFLTEEVVASLDAVARAAYRPSGVSRVDAFLEKLAPALDDDAKASLDNAQVLYRFLVDSRRGAAYSSASTAGQQLGVDPALLRVLTPLVIEHNAELRTFSAQIFARLAEQQIGRTLGALVDAIAPPAQQPSLRRGN